MNNIEALCLLIQANLLTQYQGENLTVLPDTALLEEGWLDSLTIISIVTDVERKFGIAFPEEKVIAASFRTPATLWAVIEANRVELA
ncbi:MULTISPECIES: acyl carrier protein [unclassified Pseudomonas]|jgi:acyl carrier protein|uniref:acyl carrier protein n=1 Tax=unclassified Pseudomonas TaxID=196821 RepID=UPI00131B3B62|nr:MULTISPECIES: acyl carrier protein [unclassified Pseudomonas]KAE9644236.1 acyl carrier protein [Pseudomonas sp. PB103]MBK5373366.1 acyl carrier protein [Pseudomonas sp. TH43]MBK5512158.1 acyl carrier protein [Pseudomonas sp. TH15]